MNRRHKHRAYPWWRFPALGAAIALSMAAPRPIGAQQPQWHELDEEAPADVLPSPAELSGLQVEPRVRRLVDELDASSFEKRQAATTQLREMNVDRKQFYALLTRETLSPEQRHRLIHVVHYRLLHAPRGALGISMMGGNIPGNRGGGVRITGLVPDMPAERVLKRQDRITHINGDELEGVNELVDLVQGKRPGDTITLTVQRNNDSIEVELVLGSTRTIQERESNGRSRLRVSADREQEARAVFQQFLPKPKRLRIVEWKHN